MLWIVYQIEELNEGVNKAKGKGPSEKSEAIPDKGELSWRGDKAGEARDMLLENPSGKSASRSI